MSQTPPAEVLPGDPPPTPASSKAERPLTAVVAMTASGLIGRDGDMPWRLRTDLKRFKSLTMNGWLIMGRKTFDSIGRPLPGRQTLVVTRNANWSHPGVLSVQSPQAALAMVAGQRAFVVGGAEIYSLFWPHVGAVYLTRVLASLEGDTYLRVDWNGFTESVQERVPMGTLDDYPTEFCHLTFKQP